MSVKSRKKGQGLSYRWKRMCGDWRWEIGELGILRQEEKQGVDSKGTWNSCVHKSERLPFWGGRRAGTGDLRTLLW